jgi:hypothetical protein
MAEQRAPRALGSTQGAAGSASNTPEAGGIVGRVREQATAQLDSQKTKATDGLGTVADAVRHTTRHLREGQHDTVARYAEQAADQIDRLSRRLRDKDIGELMNDAQQLARRQPALFVGGAFALGLLGARFLKSSAPDDLPVHYRGSEDYGYQGAASSGVNSTGDAYGKRVPTSPRTSSQARQSTASSRGLDDPSTEGL